MCILKDIHITGIHKYPGMKFEVIKIYVLKENMPFTGIGTYKAPGMTEEELKKNFESDYKTQ